MTLAPHHCCCEAVAPSMPLPCIGAALSAAPRCSAGAPPSSGGGDAAPGTPVWRASCAPTRHQGAGTTTQQPLATQQPPRGLGLAAAAAPLRRFAGRPSALLRRGSCPAGAAQIPLCSTRCPRQPPQWLAPVVVAARGGAALAAASRCSSGTPAPLAEHRRRPLYAAFVGPRCSRLGASVSPPLQLRRVAAPAAPPRCTPAASASLETRKAHCAAAGALLQPPLCPGPVAAADPPRRSTGSRFELLHWHLDFAGDAQAPCMVEALALCRARVPHSLSLPSEGLC